MATGVGALAYLKALGGTVVASTAGGTAAAVGGAATVAAGVGLGWHYPGIGEVTGTDEIGYSVGEWAYELLNPSYDSDYLHSITAPAHAF